MGAHPLLNKLWTKSPRDYWRRIVGAEGLKYRPWLQGKQSNWSRLAFHLELMKAFAARSGHPLAFPGTNVLEVGAGQVLGLLPLALIEGATGAAAVDPDYKEVRHERSFRDDYLFPMFELHESLFGGEDELPLGYSTFLDRVDQIHMATCTIEQMKPNGRPFDIVLSKSCLEHIADIPAAAKSLRALTQPGAVHVHYIDFSLHYAENHRIGNRFGATYENPRAACPEYLDNPGGIINLLRASDMIAAFQPHYAEVQFFPTLDYTGRLDLSRRHADWQRYDETDLGVANGVLIAVS